MTDKNLRELADGIAALARDRRTDREISVKLGIPITTVQDLRARYGIPCGSTRQEMTTADRAAMVAAARGPRRRPTGGTR